MDKDQFLTALKNTGFDLENLFSLHKKVKGTIYASEMKDLLEKHGKQTGWELVLLPYNTAHEFFGFPLNVANIFRLQIPKKKYRSALKSYSGKDVFIYLIQGTGGQFPKYFVLINQVENIKDKKLLARLSEQSLLNIANIQHWGTNK